MVTEKRHQAWLRFARDILDVPLSRSRDDLLNFRQLAMFQHPVLVPIIDEYIQLAEQSETDIRAKRPARASRAAGSKQMHLIDLLREKTFFPQNLDLARFAERVLPHMRTYRFDKMSRGDIAARIIEHIESGDTGSRDALERSMREALGEMSGKPTQDIERRSFLSKWESIIKGDND